MDGSRFLWTRASAGDQVLEPYHLHIFVSENMEKEIIAMLCCALLLVE